MSRLSARLWPDEEPVAASPGSTGARARWPSPAPPPQPASTRLSLARLVGYDDVQTVASASLKLLPLDPAEATCWVHRALPDVAAAAAAVAALTDPRDIPATAAPQIEVWAQAHARSTRRLFSA